MGRQLSSVMREREKRMDNPKPTRAKRGQTEPVRVEPEVTVGDVRRAAAVLKGAVLNTDFDTAAPCPT